jgi:hypothetical protein
LFLKSGLLQITTTSSFAFSKLNDNRVLAIADLVFSLSATHKKSSAAGWGFFICAVEAGIRSRYVTVSENSSTAVKDADGASGLKAAGKLLLTT